MIYITYTMAAWDFADIYTCSPRACVSRALGVYISKIPRSCGITIKYAQVTLLANVMHYLSNEVTVTSLILHNIITLSNKVTNLVSNPLSNA